MRSGRSTGCGGPLPLMRAARWEKALGTPAKIYFKYEGVSPAGSHKPNTAVAQAWYNKQEGITKLTTETGAGQWGSALSLGLPAVGHGMPRLHGEGLLLPEAISPEHDPGVGRGSHPQPVGHHRMRPGHAGRRTRTLRGAWVWPSAKRWSSPRSGTTPTTLWARC